jgi:methionine synthase I (cobalamin-dependent)
MTRFHDGAYGTLLTRHLHGDETVDDLCVRAPQLVVDAHRAYLDAGSTAIQTNAFLAHLRGSDRRRAELRHAALDCARTAAAASADQVLVLATIGPAGDEPRDFWESIEQALEAGVEGVLCETITSRSVADAFLEAWRDVAAGVPGVELMLGCSTVANAHPGWIVELASSAPEEVLLGLNCCEGPVGLRGILEAIVELRGTTWAMPSAGTPAEEPGAPSRWPFEEPSRWVEALLREVDGVPVAALGGCCGTTPSHVSLLCAG